MQENIKVIFTEWQGGKRPFEKYVMVDVICRSGKIKSDRPAGSLEWSHKGNNSDIVGFILCGAKNTKHIFEIGGKTYVSNALYNALIYNDAVTDQPDTFPYVPSISRKQ